MLSTLTNLDLGSSNKSLINCLTNFYLAPGASDKPCDGIYQGASVMSENEVRNLDRFLKSEQKRLVGFLDVHNYSQMWMIPWGYTKEHIKDYYELVSNSTVISYLTQLSMVKGLHKGSASVLLGDAMDCRSMQVRITKD